MAMGAKGRRGRRRVSNEHGLPVPPTHRRRRSSGAQPMGARADRPVAVGTPPRHRYRHRAAVRRELLRAVFLPRHRAHDAAFLYLCAALGAAVAICLSTGLAAAAVVAALIIALLFRTHPPRLVDQELPSQIPAAPAPEIRRLKQPRLDFFSGSILDADQAAAAIGSCLADTTRPFLAVSPPQADSSDSDEGGGSSSNGEQIANYWYPPIHLLDAGGARLILPDFIQQLQEMIPGLPQADAVELLRRAFNKSHVFCYRLSDEVESRCIMYADTHGLTDRSTRTSIMTMKITAKLFCLVWFELDGQNQQLCQEVKKECFREIVGQSMQKLLDVALSLSDAGWSTDPPLAIFDALVDVLYNIKDLPFSRTELIPNEVHSMVAHIFYKMVVDLTGILGATTNDMHSRRESTIHQATVLLVRFLEFFYRNGEMMQSVLRTGYCPIELTMINFWVSKLLRDSEIMFPAKTFHVKGQRHIFVLNNIFYVYQMKCRPGGFLSDMELESLWSLIHQYMKCYLDEYWVPVVTYLDGVSLKAPCRSSMDKFIERFFSIRDNHMSWKVRTELKQILREEIVELIIPKYENFLRILQEENPDSRWPCWSKGTWRARSEKPMYYTAAWLEQVIRGLFER